MALGLAFGSLFIVTPAHAQTLEEAKAALTAGKQEVIDATQALSSADQALQEASTALEIAREELDTAKTNYDNSMVPDPNWVHPTERVAHTTRVATTTTVTTQIQVPRQVVTTVPSGVQVTAYRNQTRTPLSTWQCASWTASNVNFNWGNYGPTNCGNDNFSVKITGYITAPATGNYEFLGDADDGFYMDIDGINIINDWYDKGGWGNWSSELSWTAGSSHSFTIWFYENGGGAKAILNAIYPGGQGVVPASWFGSTTITTTVYDTVTTTEDIVTYEDVVTYTDEPIPGATAPLVGDSGLLAILNEKQITYDTSKQTYDIAVSTQISAKNRFDIAVAAITLLEKSVVDLTPIEPVPVDPTPSPSPSPSNTVDPATPSPTPSPEVTVTPEPTPTPEPTKTEEPIVPTPEPTVEPTIPPTEEPTPEPTPSEEPTQEPTTNEPEPISEPEQATATEVLGELEGIAPTELTDAQVEILLETAMATFETAEQGSPEYEAALDALMIVAQADDVVLPAELEGIPGAAEVLAVFNALGNLGADMSPEVRQESKEIVVAAVVVGQVAQTAMAAASSAASTGGSSGPRRRIK